MARLKLMMKLINEVAPEIEIKIIKEVKYCNKKWVGVLVRNRKVEKEK